ncbi:UDP-glycosyltransferase family 305 member A1 [Haematobia irritans]|uniref:UDP-glycosyltransferase family 305 member A1 n=1 Tax=Haematobia irritans TaxID=7368 RepID=UPI003F4F62CF
MNVKVLTLAILVLIINGAKCQEKNILCLLGIGKGSSDKWNKALLQELENRNHKLTIITSTSWTTDEDDFPNAEFVHLEKTQVFLRERYADQTFEKQLQQSSWKNIMHLYDQQLATCRANLESIGFSEALHLAIKEKHKYQMIIYDITYGAGCLLHLAYLFGDIPIIGITSGHLNDQNLFLTQANLMNPAIDPYILSDFTTDMSYWKRWHNTALYAFDYLYRKWVVKPVIEGMWSSNMHAKNIFTPSDFQELLPRFKLILANYHPSLHSLKSLPVNVIPVPGLHIQSKGKITLSKEIKNFLDNTKSDIISIALDKDSIGSENIQKIMETIKSLPHTRFIWIGKKISKILGKNLPNNLILASEEESAQILAHTKVVCSLTSANILDVQESLSHGVVPITVTIKPEHRYLVQRLLERNLGVNLELTQFHEPLLEHNFNICREKTPLHSNVQQFQMSLKDQRNTSLEIAIWWVEHLLQNPKANDYLLNSPKGNSNFLILRSLDIIVVIEIFLLLCIINTVIVMRQTILNFRDMAKKSKKKIEQKAEIVKRTKKAKAKTS